MALLEDRPRHEWPLSPGDGAEIANFTGAKIIAKLEAAGYLAER